MKDIALPVLGNKEEELLTTRLRKVARELADQVDYTTVPVYTWSHSCKLIVGGVEEPCIHLPYTSALEESFSPLDVLAGSYEDLARKDVEGKVVALSYPHSYVELRLIAYSLARRKPRLVVLTPGDYLKADVLLGTPGVSDAPTVPLPTCVIAVKSSTLKKMFSSRFEVVARSKLVDGKGRVVITRINGPGEREAHVVLHHDSLLSTGLTGKSSFAERALRLLLEKLKTQEPPLNIVVASYTAREAGDYFFTEYHYTWGERYVLSTLWSKGLLDRVSYAVALGPLHEGGQLHIHAHPVLADSLRDLVARLDYNHLFMESHHYVEYGVPALTITTLPETWHIHNSSMQAELSNSFLSSAVDVAVEAFKRLSRSELSLEKIRRYLYASLGEAMLEVRTSISRLLDAAALYEENSVREFTRASYAVAGAACTNPVAATVLADLAAPLHRAFVEGISKVMSSCRGEVLVMTRECTRHVLPHEPSTRRLVEGYIEYWLKGIEANIKELVMRKVAYSYLRGEQCGVEEHRDKQV